MTVKRVTYYPTEQVQRFRKEEALRRGLKLGELDNLVWEHYMACPNAKEGSQNENHS